MKKRTFNDMLRRYNKYRRKLQRLQTTGRNVHRQNVLKKHILRLGEKLHDLFLSIKGATAVAAVTGLCMMAAPALHAQEFTTVQTNPFGLSDIGDWAKPTFGDLDGDGDMDALVGNKLGGFTFHENTSLFTTSFAAGVSEPFNLIDIGDNSTPSLVDIDNDGDLDLFTGEKSFSFDAGGDIYYFENTGSATSPSFAAPIVDPFGFYNSSKAYASLAFADLDDDGDQDALYTSSSGVFLYPENTGTASSPDFSSIGTPPFSLTRVGSYVTIEFADIDQDGDFDLYAGQINGDLFYFENIGSASAPNFAAISTNPFGLTNVGMHSSPSIVDLDADGDLDLVAGEYYGNFKYFENTALLPIDFDTKQINPFGLSDIGQNTVTSLVDLDDDGDFDLMVGERFNYYYFENTGTASAPLFATASSNPFSLSNDGYYALAQPTFVDLDNDGDLDMMSAVWPNDFDYFENIGTASSPAFDAVQVNPFSLVKVNGSSDPAFADLDNDGDLDLMVGHIHGDFYYSENTGSQTAPAFAAFTTNSFGLMNVGTASSSPSLVDLDNDGDYDLMSGEDYGNAIYFENTGSASTPSFATPNYNPFHISQTGGYGSGHTFADMDDDGDLDVFTGSGTGNIYYFENISPIPALVWDGETSSQWSLASNWELDVVPSSSDNVIIPNIGFQPDIFFNDVIVNSLVIEENARVNIAQTNTLTVSGDITLRGGTHQILLFNEASLIPLGTVTGTGSTTINKSTTFGNTDGKYSLIGSPVTVGFSFALGDILYTYDETIAYDPGGSNGGNRFVAVPSAEIMPVGDAYFTANTGAIQFTGKPNTGNINVSLVYDESNDGGATHAGYNLVSNPYTAAIGYDAFVAGNADIDGTIYIWDDGGSNSGSRTNSDYITANSIGAASGGSGRAADWDGYIRSTQGFFVKATTAGTLNFTPAMMVAGNNTNSGYFRKSEPSVLKLTMSSEKHFNEILIGFTEEASIGFDRTLDAFKVKGNAILQLYSKMDERNMAIQALPELTAETTVGLGFDIAETDTYTFEWKNASEYDFGVYLKDHQLDRLIDLSEKNSYTFKSESVNNSNRFSLVFTPQRVLAIGDETIANDLMVFSKDNSLNVRIDKELTDATVSIYNLSGVLVQQVKHVDFIGYDWTTVLNAEGVFILTVQSEDEIFVKKFLN